MRTLILFALFIGVNASAAQPEIRIGLMAEFTGQFAANGLDCRRGYEAALAVYAPGGVFSGYKVRPIFSDSQRDPKVALSEYRKLVQGDGIHVLVANSTPVAMALRPVTDRELFPYIGSTGHSDFLKGAKASFRFWPTFRDEAGVLVREMSGLKKLALASTEDEWMQGLRAAFLERCPERGLEIVFDEAFAKGERDFSAPVSRLTGAHPDAVLINMGLGQSGIFIRKLRQQGYGGPLYGNFLTARQSEVDDAGVENIEGLVLAEALYEHGWFLDALKKIAATVYVPTALSYSCFSGVAFVFEALKRDAGIRSKDEMLKALDKIDFISLPEGRLQMRNREALFDIRPKRIRAGRVKFEG